MYMYICISNNFFQNYQELQVALFTLLTHFSFFSFASLSRVSGENTLELFPLAIPRAHFHSGQGYFSPLIGGFKEPLTRSLTSSNEAKGSTGNSKSTCAAVALGVSALLRLSVISALSNGL